MSTRRYLLQPFECSFPQPLIVSFCTSTGRYAAGNLGDPLQISRGLSQCSSLLLGTLSRVFYLPDFQLCFLISKQVSLQFQSCVKMLLRHTVQFHEKRSWGRVFRECWLPYLSLPLLGETVLLDGGAWWATVHGVARVGHDWATSLSCIGEGNGNPLQCSCLENPRDGGAWWAAVYGVAQSRTRLNRLSSSSSSTIGRLPGKKWHVGCFRKLKYLKKLLL